MWKHENVQHHRQIVQREDSRNTRRSIEAILSGDGNSCAPKQPCADGARSKTDQINHRCPGKHRLFLQFERVCEDLQRPIVGAHDRFRHRYRFDPIELFDFRHQPVEHGRYRLVTVDAGFPDNETGGDKPMQRVRNCAWAAPEFANH